MEIGLDHLATLKQIGRKISRHGSIIRALLRQYPLAIIPIAALWKWGRKGWVTLASSRSRGRRSSLGSEANFLAVFEMKAPAAKGQASTFATSSRQGKIAQHREEAELCIGLTLLSLTYIMIKIIGDWLLIEPLTWGSQVQVSDHLLSSTVRA